MYLSLLYRAYSIYIERYAASDCVTQRYIERTLYTERERALAYRALAIYTFIEIYIYRERERYALYICSKSIERELWHIEFLLYIYI